MNAGLLSRRAVLTSLVGAGASASVAARIVEPEPVASGGQSTDAPVLSGSDLGFRVERVEPGGARVGALVVRVEGKWVEAKFGMRVVR